jgi:hypothetical protein
LNLVIEEGSTTLENGVYELDSRIQVNGIAKIVGESRDKTIIKAGFSSQHDSLISSAYSLDLENLTFDGSALPLNGISTDTSVNPNKILSIKNCRFTNMNGFDIIVGHNCYGIDVSDCIFQNHQMSNDQFAFECTGWAKIHDNVFDKTTGIDGGEMLTSGAAVNADVYNNIFKRTTNNGNAISFEAFDTNNNNSNIHIHGNTLYNADISIGSVGFYWNKTFRNVVIDSNSVCGGGIRVLGPNGGDFSNQIKKFSISNNTLFNSYTVGIEAYHTAGIGFIRNNTIYNSNTKLDVFTGNKGCIALEKCTDIVCENNCIYMNSTTPFGIKYNTMVNPTIQKNSILNRSINPSYISEGTHTGQILINLV